MQECEVLTTLLGLFITGALTASNLEGWSQVSANKSVQVCLRLWPALGSHSRALCPTSSDLHCTLRLGLGRGMDMLPMVPGFSVSDGPFISAVGSCSLDPFKVTGSWLIPWFGNGTCVVTLLSYFGFLSSCTLSGFLVFLIKPEAWVQMHHCVWK